MNDISLCIYSHQELRIKARQDSDMAGLQEEGGGFAPLFGQKEILPDSFFRKLM